MSYVTFSPDSTPTAHREPPASAEAPGEPADLLASVPPFVSFHTLILDLSGVSFVDLMGIKALAKVRPSGRGSTGPPHTPAPLIARTHFPCSAHCDALGGTCAKETPGPRGSPSPRPAQTASDNEWGEGPRNSTLP